MQSIAETCVRFDAAHLYVTLCDTRALVVGTRMQLPSASSDDKRGYVIIKAFICKV